MPFAQADLGAEANPLLARLDGWQAQSTSAKPNSPAQPALPSPFQSATANTDTSADAQTAIDNVRGAVEAEFGHLPEGVEIIHDSNAVDPQTGQPWAARIQNGRITLNAAHLTAQDAVANLEHEAIHELYRRAIQGDPKLRRQWEALNKVLDQHPDLAQQVTEAGYDASVRAEEISVELAQRLSATPAASAWSSFVESVRIALNQGLAAGKRNWTTRAAHRMAVRLLGQARANVQEGNFGDESVGDARYSYAGPRPARMQAKLRPPKQTSRAEVHAAHLPPYSNKVTIKSLEQLHAETSAAGSLKPN